MLWRHRRCECLSLAMTVVANPWLKCTSVNVLLFIASRSTSDGSNWTSFIDSSLHSSRNYAQSTTSYSLVKRFLVSRRYCTSWSIHLLLKLLGDAKQHEMVDEVSGSILVFHLSRSASWTQMARTTVNPMEYKD